MKHVLAISDSLKCPHSIEKYFQILNTCESIKALILREPHLSPIEYEAQLLIWLSFSDKNFDLYVHSHGEIALKYGIKHLHLPYKQFTKEHEQWLSQGLTLSTSVHSMEEAHYADANGATFLIAGPVYKTSCKPTATPKGPLFINELYLAIKCPIYAIGGLSFDKKTKDLLQNGASGVCMRSEIWSNSEHS